MEKFWILLAFLSAIFAGTTSLLAKVGIKNVNSHVATAVRTTVVTVFAWSFALALGQTSALSSLSSDTFLLLSFSGLATGASWIFYMLALKLIPASKVAPIDKFSTIIAMIGSIIIFQDGKIDEASVIAIVGITMGTVLMLGLPRKAMDVDLSKPQTTEFEEMSAEEKSKELRGTVYAFLSAFFAATSTILAKFGIGNVSAQLGMAIRTVVVLVMAWFMVCVNIKSVSFKIDGKSFLFLVLSAITTGLSWVCYYAALKFGVASVVIPIDKLSVVITVIFAWSFLNEKPSMSSSIGLVLITAGTLMLVIGQYI